MLRFCFDVGAVVVEHFPQEPELSEADQIGDRLTRHVGGHVAVMGGDVGGVVRGFAGAVVDEIEDQIVDRGLKRGQLRGSRSVDYGARLPLIPIGAVFHSAPAKGDGAGG